MNIQNIKDDIDFLCGSTSATYPVAAKIRNVNIAYHDVARICWESDGTWAFDDANNTDLPVAYRTLGNASATYTIPTTALRVEGVEIKDNSGNWTKLHPVSYHELTTAPSEYLGGGTGLPIRYQLEGSQITLYPTPSSAYTTLTSGMAVRLNRAVTEFATTASTTTPGFPVPFHRILSYAAAIDFEQDERQRQFLMLQKSRLEAGLASFFATRGTQFTPKIRPAGKANWRKYL